MSKLVDMSRIATLHSTNAKVSTALLLISATGAVYLGLAIVRVMLLALEFNADFPEWNPSWEWLAFLAALLADSTIHFIGKRATDNTYVEARHANRPGSK